MTSIIAFLPYAAADDLLNPVRRQCDPTHRYEFEVYFHEKSIEVRAIDHGPKPVDKFITLTPARTR